MKLLPLFDNNERETFEKTQFTTTVEQQNVILSYLHPLSVYESLVVCYRLGTGKTYAAACLTKLFVNYEYKVLYMSNSIHAVSNFKNEYIKVLRDIRMEDNGDGFNRFVDTMTFSKFYNKLSNNCTPCQYGLIIIDEAHNLREFAKRYKVIHDEIRTRQTMAKILIISATPMIDSEKELNSILSLTGTILEREQHQQQQYRIVFSNNDDKDLINNASGILQYEGTEICTGLKVVLSRLNGVQKEKYLHITNDHIYSRTRQASIAAFEQINRGIPLSEQAAKIYTITNIIRERASKNELTVIFCFYVRRGTNIITQALEQELGYTRWNALSSTRQDNQHGNGKTYAVIDGSVNSSETSDIMDTFNNVNNRYGANIAVLIGSSVLNESITLYSVRQVHIVSPFWNMGQINQSIGRVVRFESHARLPLEYRYVKVYQHAAYIDYSEEKGEYIGKDIDMWKLAYEKQGKIDDTITSIKTQVSPIPTETKIYNYPMVDDRLVFKVASDIIWDLTKCFDHNKYKISWCKVYLDKAEGYNLATNHRIVGSPPASIVIHTPYKTGYTIWRSCIDMKLRITYINNADQTPTNKIRRGKLIQNLKQVEISRIAKELKCTDTLIGSIIDTLKKQGRFFDKQIEITTTL